MTTNARSKRKTAAKPRAKPRNQQPTVAEMMAADVRRASFRMSLLFYGLGGVLVSGALGASLAWFVLISSIKQEERLGRLASSITVNAETFGSRLASLEREMETIRSLSSAGSRWTRENMTRFCIMAMQANKGFVCPSPIDIAPDHPAKPADPNPQSPADRPQTDRRSSLSHSLRPLHPFVRYRP